MKLKDVIKDVIREDKRFQTEILNPRRYSEIKGQAKYLTMEIKTLNKGIKSQNDKLIKKFEGEGEELDDLEWDIKSYFLMGGAMHDVAISAWGIKGYYDYIRPVSYTHLTLPTKA